MREILFRGKCIELGKHQGQWLEGFYGEDDGRSLISHSTDIGLIGYACDSDTIGQYTGSKDRNGKKIFEGDILSAHLDNIFIEEETRGCVCWNDYGWHIKTGVHYDTLEQDWVSHYFEIIGNIYDNKNLLKNQEVGE